MNLHKHQLYLLEQHRESFTSWSAIIRIDTEGKSLIMKLGPGPCCNQWIMIKINCLTLAPGIMAIYVYDSIRDIYPQGNQHLYSLSLQISDYVSLFQIMIPESLYKKCYIVQ